MDDRSEHEVLQLREHIVSGRENEWVVASETGQSERFNTYKTALAWFEQIPDRHWATLALYTRLGTSVVFHFREAVIGQVTDG